MAPNPATPPQAKRTDSLPVVTSTRNAETRSAPILTLLSLSALAQNGKSTDDRAFPPTCAWRTSFRPRILAIGIAPQLASSPSRALWGHKHQNPPRKPGCCETASSARNAIEEQYSTVHTAINHNGVRDLTGPSRLELIKLPQHPASHQTALRT
ncbi:hypothetical protein NU195Hw_Modified_398t1 [Hortaea werneckii]